MISCSYHRYKCKGIADSEWRENMFEFRSALTGSHRKSKPWMLTVPTVTTTNECDENYHPITNECDENYHPITNEYAENCYPITNECAENYQPITNEW